MKKSSSNKYKDNMWNLLQGIQTAKLQFQTIQLKAFKVEDLHLKFSLEIKDHRQFYVRNSRMIELSTRESNVFQEGELPNKYMEGRKQ